MTKKKGNSIARKIGTTLGKSTVFSGVMHFTDSLKINGSFEGEIISSGFLYVEEGAVIKADIHVDSIVVAGVVHGDIVAVNHVEMLPGGQVYGNVKTSRLRIADNVVFQGKCEMIKDPRTVDIFSARVEKLKKTVGSVG